MKNFFKNNKNTSRNNSKIYPQQVQHKKAKFHKINKCNGESTKMVEERIDGRMKQEFPLEQTKRINIKSLVNKIGSENIGKINLMEEPKTEDMMIELANFKDREEQYHHLYGVKYRESLLRQEPNLLDAVRRPKVTETLRAKMVDWMFEVIGYYKNRSSIYTFFKSVLFMDLYLANFTLDARHPNPPENSSLHRIGITCIFIASKYEDHTHLDCQELLDDSAKGKFTVDQVERTEWKILKDIQFNTTIPTHFEILDCILINNFSDRTGELYHQIRWFSLILIMKCLHFHELLKLRPYMLSLACLFVAIDATYKSEMAFSLGKERSEKMVEEKQYEVKQLVNQIMVLERLTIHEQNQLNTETGKVRKVFERFYEFFPNLKNIDQMFKFDTYMKMLASRNI